MKSEPKKAKKPPSLKRESKQAERVFSVTFDGNGKLTAVSYRGTVPADKLRLRHVGNLVRLMFEVAKALAKRGETSEKKTITFEKSDANKKLFETALKKTAKATWSRTLFGIAELADNPFNGGDWQNFGFDLAHKNSPTAVCITIGDKTIDSRQAQPDDFAAFPTLATTAATTRNYAAALGKVVLKAATKFSKSLSQHSHPVTDPFRFAGTVMRKIENTPGLMCMDMHLLSVIPPSAWFQVNVWTEHHSKIQQLAAKAGEKMFDRRRRRIHALKAEILHNPKELLLLADLMLTDQLHHIESQVLEVDQSKATSNEGIPSVDGVLLMDYGIFSTGVGEYGIILSDIPPFHDEPPEPFRVFDFPDSDRQALYYFLRHSWHKAWWDNNIRGAKVRYTVDILKQVRELPNESEFGEILSLWFFEGLRASKGSLSVAIQQAVFRLMDEANVQGGSQDELKFRKWFEKDGKKFRDSLKSKWN